MFLKFDDAAVLFKGRVFEEKGSIHIEPDYFEFKSDFTPLFTLNSEVILRCCRNGIEIIELKGEVYLSSRHYLKARTVSLTLLPGGIPFFEVPIDARVQLYRKSNKTGLDEYCTLSTISMQSITFGGIMLDDNGKDKKISVSIVKPIYDFSQLIYLEASSSSLRFGRFPKYRYKIVKLPEYAALLMARYIQNMAKDILDEYPKLPNKPLIHDDKFYFKK